MGILASDIQWVQQYEPPPADMLELGNQHLFVFTPPWPGFPERFVNHKGTPAKPYFEYAGYRHVSVDLCGEDGALVHDLCAPFDLGERFDVVTDFGTSEHVAKLHACLGNMHRHCRPGGWLLFANPEPGSWPDHGYWYRTADFYHALTKAQPGLELVEARRTASMGNTVSGWLTYAAIRKQADAPWLDEAAFEKLPVVWKTYKPDCNWRS